MMGIQSAIPSRSVLESLLKKHGVQGVAEKYGRKPATIYKWARHHAIGLPRAGSNHWKAKLTEHDVRLMRKLRDGGMLLKLIADKFEVDIRTASRICRGLSWAHVQ